MLLWSWLARGRTTWLGVSVAAVGMLIPIVALAYVHLFGSAVTPSAQAASAASAFMDAVQRQDVATERRLLSPDATSETQQFASTPFTMQSYAKQGSDMFWGYRYAVTGHPGVSELRLLVSCHGGCGVREIFFTA